MPAGVKRNPRRASGRWSLLASSSELAPFATVANHDPSRNAGTRAELQQAQLASACSVLLRRYGVVFRDILERETTIPKWRELLPMLRRMEARGEVRGGRFLSGFAGEQFALPEALESLRAARKEGPRPDLQVCVAAADPLNLVGIVVPGERVAAVAGRTVMWTQALLSTPRATDARQVATVAAGNICSRTLVAETRGMSEEPEELREGEDFYIEEGNLVFTAAYHRNRGYCCGSGCRHCPYADWSTGTASSVTAPDQNS